MKSPARQSPTTRCWWAPIVDQGPCSRPRPQADWPGPGVRNEGKKTHAKAQYERTHGGTDDDSTDLLSLPLRLGARPWAATQTGPPKDPKATRSADLVELVKLDPTIRLDIRYAGTNNFSASRSTKNRAPFFSVRRPRRWSRPIANSGQHGYGLLIHDGYRPWAVTKLFWDVTPPALREFVADPASGSKHNRGAAVDLIDVRPRVRHAGRDAERL